MDVKNFIKVTVAIGQVADYYGIPDLGPCLTGHESKGTQCFKINRGSNTFTCFRCGLCGDVISLVMLKEKLNFREALQWLVGKCSPELLPQIGEAGDIEQNANIILGVWNEAKADDTRTYKDPVDFTVKVLKNRDGKQPITIDLKFNRPLLTIRE